MNNPSQGIQISCPNCGQGFSAAVESIIDGGRDLAAKARLLSGRTNIAQCPNCGTVVQLSAPIVYHDHAKELLLIFFPPNLNFPQAERERIVGEMSRAIMNSLPQEERKGYLLNPIMPLSLEGLTEIILEKDGVTKEDIRAQQEKMQLVQVLVEAADDALADLVAEHDAMLDGEFFQLLTMAAESAAASGQRELGEMALGRRDQLIAMTSYGREAIERARQQELVVQEITAWLQAQGAELSQERVLDYLEEIGDSEEHLQAFAGLLYGNLGPQFFAALERRKQAASGTRAELLASIYQRLAELVALLQEQERAMIDQAQRILQDILGAADMDRAIAERMGFIDELFLRVVAASMQAAEEQGDLLSAARFKKVHEKVMGALRSSAPPEVQFINELLEIEDFLEARLALADRAAEFGQPLVDYLDALLQSFVNQQVDERFIEHVTALRDAADKIVGEAV